ncbi:hypothetical protein FRC11_013155, partial [Ceratobasidium sp. 423]
LESQAHQSDKDGNGQWRLGQKEHHTVGAEKSDSKSNSVHASDNSKDVGMDKVPGLKQGLRCTGAAFTSNEIAKMSHNELVQSLKDAQHGKISNKPHGGSGNLTAANQPSATTNTLVAHNLTKQELKNAVKKHCWQSFQMLTGMKDRQVCQTVKDTKGVIQYWTPNEHSINQLTPAWENGFLANMKVWKKEFLQQCRVESEMPPLAREYLKTASNEVLISTLEKGVWKMYLGYVKKEAEGTCEQKQVEK